MPKKTRIICSLLLGCAAIPLIGNMTEFPVERLTPREQTLRREEQNLIRGNTRMHNEAKRNAEILYFARSVVIRASLLCNRGVPLATVQTKLADLKEHLAKTERAAANVVVWQLKTEQHCLDILARERRPVRDLALLRELKNRFARDNNTLEQRLEALRVQSIALNSKAKDLLTLVSHHDAELAKNLNDNDSKQGSAGIRSNASPTAREHVEF
ncbi:MAG: hypothetical protein LBG65_04520 [Puniceicoccales bacterium]|nr:hypothetical protein [Puniceicoccales bacterium]